METPTQEEKKPQDPNYVYFLQKWKEHKQELSTEEKGEIGKAYMKHILGADENTIMAFLRDDSKAHHDIGMRCAGVTSTLNDYQGYWGAVSKYTPKDYPKDKLAWLIENSNELFVSYHHGTIDSVGGEESLVNFKLNLCAHAYK